jgi:1-aminocyclopropane-1-carboxylate deaminase
MHADLFDNPVIRRSALQHPILQQSGVSVDLLRLDCIHPQISGNKWFKLKYNIREAFAQHVTSLLSFGGAYSNHLHALAYAGKLLHMHTIGFVRGEATETPTLLDCKKWGMTVFPISRSSYRQKEEAFFLEQLKHQFPHAYIIPEGGDNELGRMGCTEIIPQSELPAYSHLCCPVGTGTTFSGIINSALPQQQVLGFAALKQGDYLNERIQAQTNQRNWILHTRFHEGGFAKATTELIQWINEFQHQHGIELDRVYTAKMMKGIFSLISEGVIPAGSRVLALHTGGLQGNRSLE